MNRLHLIPLLLIFAFVGCNKDGSLPQAVRGGPNMFACKVNGKNFIAQDENSLSGRRRAVDGGITIDDYMGVKRKYLFMLIRSGTGSFTMYLDSLEIPRIYLLQDDVTEPKAYYILPQNDYMVYNQQFYSSSKHTGWIDFSILDKSRNEVMGTFEFEGVDKKGNTVKVTDGRFYNHVTGP